MSWKETASGEGEQAQKPAGQTTNEELLSAMGHFTGWQSEDDQWAGYPHPIAAPVFATYDAGKGLTVFTLNKDFGGYPHTGVPIRYIPGKALTIWSVEETVFGGYPHTGAPQKYEAARTLTVFSLDTSFGGYPHTGVPVNYDPSRSATIFMADDTFEEYMHPGRQLLLPNQHYLSLKDDAAGEEEGGGEGDGGDVSYIAQGIWKKVGSGTQREARYKKGYTHPELFRIKAVEPPRDVAVTVYGLNSYRTTEWPVHDENATESEVP